MTETIALIEAALTGPHLAATEGRPADAA
jgi:hypothetical protein